MRMLSLLWLSTILMTEGPAQRPSTWRCAHVLAEDGQTWRDDMIVTTMLDQVVSVKPSEPGQQVDVEAARGRSCGG